MPLPAALVWLALVGTGRAADPDAVRAPDATTEQDARSEQARLEDAVSRYQSGRWDSALIALTAIISDPTVSRAVQQEARVYLGEVQYTRGDQEGARKI